MHTQIQPRPPRRWAIARPQRFVGLDIVRLLAILGMMAAHLWAPRAAYEPGNAPIAEAVDVITDGTASALFAVVGGVSLVLASRGPERRYGKKGVLVALWTRALLVAVLGLIVGMLSVPVVIVLTYFGVAIALAAPLVLASTRVVATVAVALSLGGSALNAWIRSATNLGSYDSLSFWQVGSAVVHGDPLQPVLTVLVTGVYPAITWVAYLLFGVLIARRLIVSRERGSLRGFAIQLAALGGAALGFALVASEMVVNVIAPAIGIPDDEVLAAAQAGFGAPFSAPWSHFVAYAHTGTPMEIIKNVGLAALCMGVLVALLDTRASPRVSSPVRWLQATGSAPLTVYVAHLLMTLATYSMAMAMADEDAEYKFAPWWVAGFGAWGVQVVAVMLIGLVLLLARKRGPLEALIAATVRFALRKLPSAPA